MPRRAASGHPGAPRAYAVPTVALAVCASLVLALAGCGQPTPSDDTVAPTVSVPVQPTTSIGEVIQTMSRGGYRRVPIVDPQDRLVGIIKVSNIVNHFVEHFPQAVFNLPPQPNVVMPEREGA